MELKVSGKLKTASAQQPSFEGFRIEAWFDRKPAPTPSRPSTSRPVTGRATRLDDATATSIETGSESGPYQSAAASAPSTSAEAPIPSRVSALSDDAGNFTLVLPNQHEIVSETVRFTVSSPARRIIREMEVMTRDLGEAITIEVEAFEDKTEPRVNTPQSVAVDVLFQTDAVLRQTITKNLSALRGESELIAARVEKAWKFSPSQLSVDELERRNYVARGADPYKVLETVAMSGANALRSAKIKRTLTLRKSAELEKLIKNNQEPADSLPGVVELGPLIEFIQRRGAGPIEVADLTSTRYRADAEADAILNAVGDSDRGGITEDVAPLEGSSSGTGGADDFVKNTVNVQMKSATSPESLLVYGKIPNSVGEDKNILQTFQLRLGPTDVTSYHDFHTLQIAFDHVWTEIFDGQLTSLGRDLYSEYVKLKDFIGSTQPDLQIGTLPDLRRLIAEVKRLGQTMEDGLPCGVRLEGGGSTNPKSPSDAQRLFADLGKVSPTAAILGAIIDAISAATQKPRIRWSHFPGPFPGHQARIIATFAENVAPEGYVEIKLESPDTSLWRGIDYQEVDVPSKRSFSVAKISNNASDGDLNDRNSPQMLTLDKNRLSNGLLEFDSQQVENGVRVEGQGGRRGRFLLGELDQIADRTRVTFTWITG
jgi:hypothetical protein